MLVLDIETIPAVPEEIGIALAMKQPDFPEWRQYCSTTPPLAKIVCVGLWNGNAGLGRAYVNAEASGVYADEASYVMPDEAAVVKAVFAIIQESERWPVVTFSGRTFDLPMLFAAALRHELTIPQTFQMLMSENRFRPCDHIDMREIVTNFGACKGGLRAWCIGTGIGDPKASGDGADVGRLVAAGAVAQVAEYCLSDCRFTADLYRRWCRCTGRPT